MFYEDIFRNLNKKRIDYLVVGGVAFVLHGVVRLTADLDLMISLQERNVASFVDLMNKLGYKPRIQVKAEELIRAENRKQWSEEKNMKVFSFYHPRQPLGLIDIFIYEPVDYRKAKVSAVMMKVGNLSIPVASVNDLIAMKKISGRKQDLEDIKALKRIKGYEKKTR